MATEYSLLLMNNSQTINLKSSDGHVYAINYSSSLIKDGQCEVRTTSL